MHRYLSQTEIESQAWDACVFAGDTPVPYGHFAWLRAVANGRFGALVWEEGAGKPSALFPFVERAKFGVIPYSAMPPFTQRLGLFAGPGEDRVQMAAEAAAYLNRRFLRVDIAVEDEAVAKALGGQRTPMRNLVLDLSTPLPQLEAGLGKSIRQKLKQAAAAGLRVEATPTGLSAFRFIRAELAPRLADWTVEYDFAWGRLCVIPHAPFTVVGRMVYKGEEQVAAAVFVEYGNRTIYLAGASNAQGLETGAMAYLLWQEIENRTSPIGGLLDFEGGNMGGTGQFFSMFGAEAETYWRVRLGI